MNVHMRRRGLLLCLALSLIVLIAACSGNNEKSAESTPDQPTSTKAPSTATPPAEKTPPAEDLSTIDKPVTLYVKDYSGSFDNPPESFQLEYADPVKAKFPNVTLKLTPGSLTDESILAKEPMDITSSSIAFLPELKAFGLEADLEPLIKKYNFDITRLNPEAIQASLDVTDGVQAYLPLTIAHQGALLYNKEIFDRFGEAYPTDGMTWDEVYDLAKRLTRVDNGQQYLGYTVSLSHYFRRNQLSVNVVDPNTLKVSLNNDDVKAVVENILRFYMLEGYDRDKDKTGAAQSMNAFIVDRNTAMYSGINGYTPTEESLAGMNWDAVSYPIWPGKPNVGPMVYPSYLGVSNSSQHPDEAFKVINYLLSEEFQVDKVRRGIALSSLNDRRINEQFGAELPIFDGKNAQAFVYGSPAPSAPQSKYYRSVADGMYLALLDVMKRDEDINTALRQWEEAMTLKVEEMRTK